MDIPLNVEIHCADGLCGQSTYVIINPVDEQVTHVVVKERGLLQTERLVPLDLIVESSPDLIRLRCTREELSMLDTFIDIEFVPGDSPEFTYEATEYVMWPYAHPMDDVEIPIERERIPPGELAARHGMHVTATDGRAGQVDEFLVDPVSGHITHLILREGHLWGQKDISIPVSEIKRIEEDTVYLKLSKTQIEGLPIIPVKRRYTWLKE